MEDILHRQSKIGNSHQVRSMTDQEDDYPIYYFTVMVSQCANHITFHCCTNLSMRPRPDRFYVINLDTCRNSN